MTELSASRIGVFYSIYSRYFFRSWRFYGMLLVTIALVGGMSILFFTGGMKFPSSSSEFLEILTGNVNLDIVVVAVFFGGDAFSQDFYSGTGLMVLTQPVSRPLIFSGRFLSSVTFGAIIVGVYYIGAAAASIAHYGNAPFALLASYGLAFLFLLSCLSFAFFFSALFKSISVSIIATFMLLFIGFLAIVQVMASMSLEPWFILTYAGNSISGVLLNPYPAHYTTYVIDGSLTKAYFPTLLESIVIMVVYLAITIILSLVAYVSRELK